MSDIILDALKQFLYERQLGQKGKLDGSLYFCKGNINDSIKPSKSILPCYMIMERWQGFDNKIYYKCYVQPDENGSFKIIKKKETCQLHFFKKPIGSILLLIDIISNVDKQTLTFITDGNSIKPYFTKFNTENFNTVAIQIFIQNILSHFEFVDFKHHQYFNTLV